MKKYMIRTDIEGVTGVVSYEQSVPGHEEYASGQSLFMGDLLALINGLNDGGADEIYLYDEHCDGRNIDISVLPENVKVYIGKPPYTKNWAGGLDGSFSGLLMLGFHSKAGYTDKLLSHSYESDIKDIRINGFSVGEIGMETAIAGEYSVPLLVVTGDSEGVKEGLALAPDALGVVVKESESLYGALCYPTSVTQKKIYEAGKKAASETVGSVFTIEGPITLEIDFFDTVYAEKYAQLFGSARFTGDTILSCWAQYQENKQLCLASIS